VRHALALPGKLLAVQISDFQADGVRATTALIRMLRLPGAWASDLSFSGERVIVTVRL
jgi:hypothetical protein